MFSKSRKDLIREMGLEVEVKRILIENFKSIKHLELELNPGINLLVGPNAGGKSNILEALHFLYKALIGEAGKTPYIPYPRYYWSPLDLVYARDPEKQVMIGLDLSVHEHEELYREGGGNEHKQLENRIVFKTFFAVTPGYKTIMPVKYVLEVNNATKIELSVDGIVVNIEKSLFEYTRNLLHDEYEFMEYLDSYVLDGKKMYYTLRRKWREIEEPLILFKIPVLHALPESRCRRLGKESLCIIVDYLPSLRKRKIGYIVKLYGKRIVVGERRRMNRESRCASYYSGFGLPLLRDLLKSIVGHIILLRHPDIGSLLEPQPFLGEPRLDERAVNLAPILLYLQGRQGGLPARISRMLETLFPQIKLRLESVPPGRVILLGEENGLELHPPNLPDGLFKILSILAAIELKPSILLIDEIENSLHARMLEYVVDELNSQDIPVIAATHSPVIVDLVGPEKTNIVYRKPGEGTVTERIEDPDTLSRRLSELGVTFSDYIFHEKTYHIHGYLEPS